MKRVLLLLLLAVAHCGFAMDLVTPSGKLQGALSSRATDIAVFKGIPYAIAPIGARRWTYADAHPGSTCRNTQCLCANKRVQPTVYMVRHPIYVMETDWNESYCR